MGLQQLLVQECENALVIHFQRLRMNTRRTRDKRALSASLRKEKRLLKRSDGSWSSQGERAPTMAARFPFVEAC